MLMKMMLVVIMKRMGGNFWRSWYVFGIACGDAFTGLFFSPNSPNRAH